MSVGVSNPSVNSKFIEIKSKYWTNLFEPPSEYKDTEEYEYVEYPETVSAGGEINENQPDLRFYNRDVDPWLYFRKGYIMLTMQLVKSNG
jgi:hypothetical protein